MPHCSSLRRRANDVRLRRSGGDETAWGAGQGEAWPSRPPLGSRPDASRSQDRPLDAADCLAPGGRERRVAGHPRLKSTGSRSSFPQRLRRTVTPWPPLRYSSGMERSRSSKERTPTARRAVYDLLRPLGGQERGGLLERSDGQDPWRRDRGRMATGRAGGCLLASSADRGSLTYSRPRTSPLRAAGRAPHASRSPHRSTSVDCG